MHGLLDLAIHTCWVCHMRRRQNHQLCALFIQIPGTRKRVRHPAGRGLCQASRAIIRHAPIADQPAIQPAITARFNGTGTQNTLGFTTQDNRLKRMVRMGATSGRMAGVSY